MNPDGTDAPDASDGQDQTTQTATDQTADVQADENQQGETQDVQTDGEEAASTDAAETTDASQSTQADAEEEPVDWSQYIPRVTQPIPTTAEGQVDPEKYREQIKDEMRFEQQEYQGWQRLEKQYPEIRKDPELRKMIVANRLFDVQNGGKGTLDSAAKVVFDKLGGARNEGKAQQTTNMTVQKSAALQSPSGVRAGGDVDKDVRARINAGDQGAIHTTLSSWIQQGKI